MIDDVRMSRSQIVGLSDVRIQVVQFRIDGLVVHQLPSLVPDCESVAVSPEQEIMRLIDVGAAEWAQWAEIVNLIERRRWLVETEQKRRVAMQNLIKVEDAYIILDTIMYSLREAVFEHVSDAKERQATMVHFQNEYNRLTSRQG